MRREELFLRDMIQSADAIAGFVAGLDFSTFEQQRMIRNAIIWEVTIIGEAARNIPSELRLRRPAVPWSRIVAFRNVVIHRYFGTDWLEVWNTATRNVPVLRAQIAAVLAIEFPEDGARLTRSGRVTRASAGRTPLLRHLEARKISWLRNWCVAGP